MSGARSDPTEAAYRRHLSSGWAGLVSLAGAHVESAATGAYLFDRDGKRFLDCGGYGIFFLGHRHPKVIAAIERELRTVPMTGRAFFNRTIAHAAAELTRIAPAGLDHVYMTTSGSEAVELALKLALTHGRHRFIAMQGGFHGKSLGALSVAGSSRYDEDSFAGFPRAELVPFGDARALRALLQRTDADACVILEPILGEGGVVVPPEAFVGDVAQACREAGALLIVDEIQTGLGRAGEWWSSATTGVVPDILLAGKALSGGVMPIGAVLAGGALYEPLNRDPFMHSTTFGNGTLAAAAAAATIGVIEEQQLVARARKLGEQLIPLIAATLRSHCGELVVDVRGRGLLIGIELARPSLAGELLLALMRQRVIASFTVDTHTVVRLTPPAVIDEAEIELLIGALARAGDEIATIADAGSTATSERWTIR